MSALGMNRFGMKRSHIVKLALAALCMIGCNAADSKSHDSLTKTASGPGQNDSAVIAPGQGVGLVRLGDTRGHAKATFEEVFGNKYFDEEVLRPTSSCWPSLCCEGVTKLHWLDFDRKQNGVYVYASNGRVIQIEVATTRYATPGRITHDSPPDEVRHQYPNLVAYVRLGYHSEAEGGRDVIYWDDLDGGVAFEFWYDPDAGKRYLESIIIHQPGVQLIPNSCAASSSDWQKLEPFALELPNSTPQK